VSRQQSTAKTLGEVLAVRLLDAAWSGGRDITSESVIGEIPDDIGLNGHELLAKATNLRRAEWAGSASDVLARRK
jgi:predicted DsbA family dithiol-disulfide isomerase